MDNRKPKRKENDRLRTFTIPAGIYERSVGVRDAKRMVEKKLKMEDAKDAEKIISIYNHSISTANFTYLYYNEYLKGKTEIDPDSLYLAAIYFNYYKFTVKDDTDREPTQNETIDLMRKKQQTNREIRELSGQQEAVRYLFVTDAVGKSAHEIIFAANAIDNLMCIKNAKGEPLSLATVFSVISSSESFSPIVVKNFEELFVHQIHDSAKEYKISFASQEEKTAFEGLDNNVKNSLFTVISMVIDDGDDLGQISVEDLKNADSSKQLIVFTSDPTKPQQFYDKRTNTLYSIT